jgi:DNA-binding LytR/AlgR family response regulator
VQIADSIRFVATPLPLARFGGLGAALTVAFAAYCMLHGVVSGGSVHPPISVAWALAICVPWCTAWEGLKRLNRLRETFPRICVAATIVAAALASNVSLEHAVAVVVNPDAHRTWLELLYQRFPLAVGIAAAACFVRAPAPGSGRVAPAVVPEPAPTPIEIDVPAFAVPTRHGIVTVRGTEIDFVRAAGNYVELVSGGRALLLRATLSDIARRLEPIGFVRIHRSSLVRRSRVTGVRRDSNRRMHVQLAGGQALPVGRQFREAARSLVEVRRHQT